MESLPTDIINEILFRLDRPSLYHASQVSPLWRSLSLQQVVPIDSQKKFKEACRRGDRLSIVKSPLGKYRINLGLVAACCGGHRDVVELMIEKGANDWNSGLRAACEEGHRDLVEL